MINFMKNTIFSRDTKEVTGKEEILHGGVLAVWGSPGSGKSTVAVKLAKYLADKKKNVVLVLCDMTAPMLPCICPPSDLDYDRISKRPYGSLGSILSATHVTESLVKYNMITHKSMSYLTLIGMLKGENEYTYASYTKV
jgi:Mrp family chromosome partitioning ATPase